MQKHRKNVSRAGALMAAVCAVGAIAPSAWASTHTWIGADGTWGDATKWSAAGVPNATRLKESIVAHQTSAEDAGRVAQAAGVKVLVLSHFVPPDDPEVTEQMWIDAARVHFRGLVIVGRDLLEI